MVSVQNMVDRVYVLRNRFRNRADSEHEQAFVRLAIGVILVSYFAYFTVYSEPSDNRWALVTVAVLAGFIACCTVIIIAIAIRPGISPARRLFGVALDSGTITYFAYATPQYAAPLYCLYLWIIFGHGFRFGRPYLFFALALSFVGFGATVFYSPFWADHLTIGIGLWIGMLLVSLYISTLVKRLTNALEDADASKKSLTAALESAEQANQAKRRFISSVSHEMRTPLNAIIGMGNLIQSSKLDEEQSSMIRTINNASQMMLSLIEGVLDFSKIEAGKLVIEKTEFAIRHLVQGTVDIFKHEAKERGLRLTIFIQSEVPNLFIGDPYHLRQVLVNLMGNAIKFTENGSITLSITALEETTEEVRLRFEVADTGIGMTSETQQKIFNSFTQADDSTTRRYGGTGLGTTISKQLVELMGGTIGVHSKIGEGSTFWFELRLPKSANAGGKAEVLPFRGTPLQDAAPPTPRVHRRTSNYNVLVADDNSMNRQVLQKILEREGHSCVMAENGEVALDALGNESFDAIVLDMNMPVMSGLEAAKAYRFMTANDTRAPIIMFSADVTTDVIEQCRFAGIDRFLPKPINVDEFLAALEDLVETFNKHRKLRLAPTPKWKPPVVAQPPGDTTLINVATLMELERLGQNAGFVAGLIAAFKADTAITIKQLDTAFQQHRFAELGELVHALKGAAISLGAVALRHACHALEVKTRAEFMEAGISCLTPMKTIYASTLIALDEYMGNREKQSPHNQP